MALSASIVWELRTTGSANNGGGFKTGASGTDYSQQAASQYSLTGLTSAGAGAVILSASAAAVMVGNIINITGGTNFTTGRYEITSVSVGVSITVDRNVTTGVGASGTGEVGGAVALPQTIGTAILAGHIVYMKATATYTATATATLTPSTGGEVLVEGYTTTRGDKGIVTITTATNSVDIWTLNAATTYVFRYLTMTNTATTRGQAFHPNGVQINRLVIDHCVMDGHNPAIQLNGSNTNVYLMITHCEIKNFATAGFDTSRTCRLFMYATWVHGGTSGAHGIKAAGNFDKHFSFVRCVISDNAGDGINDASSSSEVNWFIYACAIANNTGDGFEQTDTGVRTFFHCSSTIFYGNGGLGIKWQATLAPAAPTLVANAFGSNTGGNYSSNVPAGVGDVTLTANPFVSGTDYSLNSTAGGGAACKNVGDPTAIP